MRIQAKTWGVIGRRHNAGGGGFLPLAVEDESPLQTVLITASGPQAYNALVHRERYTQGSRQNRCVSSQEALALRAKLWELGRHCLVLAASDAALVVGFALAARVSTVVSLGRWCGCSEGARVLHGARALSPWHP